MPNAQGHTVAYIAQYTPIYMQGVPRPIIHVFQLSAHKFNLYLLFTLYAKHGVA
jgi:hypothetical protein